MNLIKICVMTSRSYFEKMNSTLGSVVPLAMFFQTTLSHEICLLKVVVGRGPLTGLKDKRVGRRQLVLTSNQGVVQVGSGLHICHSEKLTV